MKKLDISYSSMTIPKKKINFPSLEECELDNNNNFIIDFSNMINLKKLSCYLSDFLNLNSKISKLEIIKITPELSSVEDEKKMLEKLISIKTLKEIEITLQKIKINEISKIKGENISLKRLLINWKNNDDLVLYYLQEKFPNLTDISVKSYNNNKDIKFDIKENPDYKVDKFYFIFGGCNIKFYCTLFENLKEINFDNIKYSIINLENTLPIFSDKCHIVFKSLTKFSFCYYNEINYDILINIFNNLDHMPKLKEFKINCFSKYINKEFHKNFIIKLLSLKIKIYLNLQNEMKITDLYSENELKHLYPDYKAKLCTSQIFKFIKTRFNVKKIYFIYLILKFFN